MLLNFVSHALKYSPRGGLLALTSEFTVENWRVAIEEDGAGGPAEQRERIFGRIVRLDDGGHEGETGRGLGLAISRSIRALAARHHGTALASEAGAG